MLHTERDVRSIAGRTARNGMFVVLPVPRTWRDRLLSISTGTSITIAGLWVILVSAAAATATTSLALRGYPSRPCALDTIPL